MNLIEDRYKSIKTVLSTYKLELQRIDEKREIERQLYEKDIQEIDERLANKRQELELRISRTKAMLDIAKTHTSRHMMAAAPIQYDHGALARLAVQISSGNPNDPFAEKLYTEASGQLLMLEDEHNHLDEMFRAEKERAERAYIEKKNVSQSEKKRIIEETKDYLNSQNVKELVTMIRSKESFFNMNETDNGSIGDGSVSIGLREEQIPICVGCEEIYQSAFGRYVDMATETLCIPADINLDDGSSVVVKYENENEQSILTGINNLIINFGRIHRDSTPHVFFFDPVRYNASALGTLATLCGNEESLIENVPTSPDEIKKTIKTIVNELNQNELMAKESDKKLLIIIHDFPQGYDGNVVSQIQQLCVNAKHFNINILLTTNTSGNAVASGDVIKYIESFSEVVSNNQICSVDGKTAVPFSWFNFNGELPADIVKRYIDERPVIDKSSVYEQRIGLPSVSEFHKGYRRLEDIPYGIDRTGNIQSVSFEDSNFATFICGASRSGKSTLLHTIISGIIKNTHPDDVEIWLIDFKMTEFSRYANHLPPHVRYIILDESPELVYDIINRLTEILQKRQNIFKGKWLKLDDVPTEKYMPSIVVIIDEFSVMSQIIADSIVNSKDNYSIKLQTLLAKGAALGLHFIFASQGFTSGTRGLNDFSKKQIQQRIAMKTEYNEIRETLDLKSASDDDKAMMEQLPVYHALTRKAVDKRGNHLRLAEVLYISDYRNQERMIDSMNDAVVAKPKYLPQDNGAYIDKRTMIIDGNVYLPFDDKSEEIKAFLRKHDEVIDDGDTGYVFLGEPRRMMPIYPIEISKGFCENILLLAPNNEKMPATSILLSLEKSLELQDIPMEIWTSKRNALYKQYVGDCQGDISCVIKELPAICNEIKKVKSAIDSKNDTNRFIVLLGFESIVMDMAFQDEKNKSSANVISPKDSVLSELTVEKRKPGEMDLLLQLSAAENGELSVDNDTGVEFDLDLRTENEGIMQGLAEQKSDNVYDAREDLKYILTHGPNLGYHFVMVFNSVGEIKQSKTDLSLFKHKIVFRTSRQEAMEVIGSSGANIVAEMDDHTFRYTDGIGAVSFRPFLHKGVTWDGWKISEDGNIDSFEDEEEYLL